MLVTGVTPMVAMEEGAVLRVLSDHKTWAETNGNEGRRADFTETNLSGRDLSNRNLSAMSFSGYNLKSIDFRESILAACNFSNANLRAANLSRADLRGAVFQWAVLQDACLAGARIGILPGTGLETVFPDGFALETDSPSPLPPRPEPP